MDFLKKRSVKSFWLYDTQKEKEVKKLLSKYNKKPKRLENSQLLRKIWHVNQIFELILEQRVPNYYGDMTIAKHGL